MKTNDGEVSYIPVLLNSQTHIYQLIILISFRTEVPRFVET